jgi:hypothetical protein
VGNREEARRSVPLNSTISTRNVFIHDGRLYIVTDYHKSRSATDIFHLAARCLTTEVAELLLLYIAYIRPFANMLWNKISEIKNTNDGDYVFCDVARPLKSWDGNHLSEAMRRLSAKHHGCPSV